VAAVARAADLSFERLVTERLVLEPIAPEVAEAVVAGDLSDLCAGDGWPHADTVDGLGMAVRHGHAASWFVTLDGGIIGDCGTHGPPDEAGDVEIGYGLAAPYRGRGYGNELVVAASEWLLGRPGVRRVVAREVLADNVPSRRALERAGFVLEREARGLVWYALGGSNIGH
jgi:RimJ/RimL family protein N-acetyltransferase